MDFANFRLVLTTPLQPGLQDVGKKCRVLRAMPDFERFNGCRLSDAESRGVLLRARHSGSREAGARM